MKKIAQIFSLALSPLIFANEARIIADQLALGSLLNVINGAHTQIDALQFSFAIDKNLQSVDPNISPTRIANALRGKAATIPVSLYIENERDTSVRNKFTADYLSAGGVNMSFGPTHAKGVVADRLITFLGSTNLTQQSLERNNETNLLIADAKLAAEVIDYIQKLKDNPHRPREPRVIPINETLNLLEDGAYLSTLVNKLETLQAGETFEFSMYYFTHEAIKSAIKHAVDRGVLVKGYINSRKRTPEDTLPDQNSDTVRELLAFNEGTKKGKVSLYWSDDAFFSHSKIAIFNKKSLMLGTGNWNPSDVSEHPQLYLELTDSGLADRLSTHLAHQIAYESKRTSPEKLYHRFWLGWKRADKSLVDFDQGIQNIFIDATLVAASKRGLMSYIPWLPLNPSQNFTRNAEAFLIPDEIAIVTYRDEETYLAARASPIGSVYGPFHGEYFQLKDSAGKSVSGSFLTTDSKEIAWDKAYDFSQDVNDQNQSFWQSSESIARITLRKEATTEEDYKRELATYFEVVKAKVSAGELVGYLALPRKNYLIEYVAKTSPTDSLAALALERKTKVAALEENSLEETKVKNQDWANFNISRSSGKNAISLKFNADIQATKNKLMQLDQHYLSLPNSEYDSYIQSVKSKMAAGIGKELEVDQN